MNLDIGNLRDEAARIKEEDEKRENGGKRKSKGKSDYVKMPEGKGSLVLRIMPPSAPGVNGDGKGLFFLHSRMHRVKRGDRWNYLHCPRLPDEDGKLQGECEICKYMRHIWKESESSTPEEKMRLQALYRSIKANDRYFYNVIVRDEKQEDGTKKDSDVLKWSVPKQIHQIIINGICGDPDVPGDTGFADVTDIKNGRDFVLIKTIKSGPEKWPEYVKSHFSEETSPLADPSRAEEILGSLHDLSAIRVVLPQEELEQHLKIHLGLESVGANDDFDASKYNNSPSETVDKATVTETVSEPEPEVEAVTEPVEVKKETKKAKKEEVAEDKPVPADEFMAELQDLGK